MATETAPPIEFRSIRWGNHVFSPTDDRTIVFLETDKWDDSGYQTTFGLHVATRTEVHYIGQVKILHVTVGGSDASKTTADNLPASPFSGLSSDKYCSLGQSTDYYIWMREHWDIGERILQALADITTNPNAAQWRRYAGFETSLLRFSDAQKALEEAKDILAGTLGAIDFSFVYELRIPEASENHRLEVRFPADSNPRRRINALIGPNGGGKSTLLTSLATDLSTGKELAQPPKRRFSRQILVSHSAFDISRRPAIETQSSYRYVGLAWQFEKLVRKLREHVKDSPNEGWPDWWSVDYRFPENLLNILTAEPEPPPPQHLQVLSSRKENWKSILDPVMLSSDEIEQLVTSLGSSLERLSSGQQAVVRMLAGIAFNLDNESVVLLDEPENHLHPALLSGFMLALMRLLEERNSYAIVATHSPLVVRDISADCVTVVGRVGNQPEMRRPRIQTFGASLPAISEDVFGVDQWQSHWRMEFTQLSSSMSPQQIEQLFEPGLTAEARTHLRHIFAGHDLGLSKED